MLIRPETPADIAAIHAVEAAAFGREDEADIVDAMRDAGVLDLSLVAEIDGRIAGHIAFSPASVENAPGGFRATDLAPLAVAPERQRQGVGAALMEVGIDACRRLGFDAVFLVGHPEYYPRFGFREAAPLGLLTPIEVPSEAWMVLELRPGALDGVSGVVHWRPELSG